ncbi:hypothetical protein BpHYR1_008108 [Brachionus plicatilis]|uniref:Uncharacterized protein n=1 Tax=Brachionus plicatilis TaxID=10195 RepID=A0A3M7QZL0_BRAPC|nr:hypothetical protein BpHYR1_008108 [Brachionus plicatilis]
MVFFRKVACVVHMEHINFANISKKKIKKVSLKELIFTSPSYRILGRLFYLLLQKYMEANVLLSKNVNKTLKKDSPDCVYCYIGAHSCYKGAELRLKLSSSLTGLDQIIVIGS